MSITAIMENRYLKSTLLLISILSILSACGYYWWQKKHFISTDDAYVNAHIVQIASRISGQVTRLLVENNQYVKRGQVLFILDKTPFEISQHEALAELARQKALLDIATITANRTQKLAEKHAVSMQEVDTTSANLRSALAALQLAEAHLQQVQLNLKYTEVTAPTSGWVTNVTLHAGNIVAQNQPVFALISDENYWIDANFKETELSKIRPDQKVKVTLDMYRKHPFQGIVESISGGTGSAFSLLPPQNATGNWVKITQRVPVRIRIIDPDHQFPLRIGTSANAKIQIG